MNDAIEELETIIENVEFELSINNYVNPHNLMEHTDTVNFLLRQYPEHTDEILSLEDRLGDLIDKAVEL